MVDATEANQVTTAAASLLYLEIDVGVGSNATYTSEDFDALNLGFVFEDVAKAVERPPVQVEVPVSAPVLRVAVFVVTDACERPDVDTPNTASDARFHNVCGETMEEVGAALRPCVMQASCTVTARIVARGNFFREVVAVLFQDGCRDTSRLGRCYR